MKTTLRKSYVIVASLLLAALLLTLLSIKAIAGPTYITADMDEKESIYLDSVKQVLRESNIVNAGVTMTKTTENGYDFEYSLCIHANPENIKMIGSTKEIDRKLLALDMDIEGAKVNLCWNRE